MGTLVELTPLTRIEGHLGIRLELDGGKVASAYCAGEMFRGFENILKGRDPLDAQQITQRICGVCPISHGLASILAQEQIYRPTLTPNGVIARNLILGANYIQSHLIHFYQLSALDFVDVTAILGYHGADPALNDLRDWVSGQRKAGAISPGAPFLPRYAGHYIQDAGLNVGALKHYLQALDMRALAHQAVAVWAGKAPHATALAPGGVTEQVSAKKIAAYAAIIDQLRVFIDTAYLPDTLAVAAAFPEYFQHGAGPGDFMAFGVFPQDDGFLLPAGRVSSGRAASLDLAKITEQTTHSLFSSPSGLHPAKGQTTPAPRKSGAYSWLKAPRYDGRPQEVGPLARILVAYQAGHAQVRELVDQLLGALGRQPAELNSAMGRHAARAIECKLVAEACARWINQLKPGEPTYADFDVPASGAGAGLIEAPRGALGHWIEIADYRIANYQCVVPTTWNCSPRDDAGVPGPVESSLEGLPVADPQNPLEAARVVRSFDPCLACAVH